jgi:hypothetical protein
MSVEDACNFSNLGVPTFIKLINSGPLPARKRKRRSIIIRSEFEAALKALPEIGGEAA